MPCQSDYLDPSGQELESKRVCRLICYLNKKLSRKTESWVKAAAKDYYGNVNRLDEATAILCGICRRFTSEETESIIYDAHSSDARDLASWWERHQEWDKRRIAEEEESRKKIMLKDRAIKKLSVDERIALGLHS